MRGMRITFVPLASFFAHECNPNDSSVIAHVPHVRQTIASTSLLHYIQEAHKLRGTVRIAQEINLQYIDMRQVTTNLTDSQTVTHAHYAKIIRNPVMMIATVMRITTVMMITTVMRITTANMTTTTRYTAMIQKATNDNQRH
jgi:hypothetical protein